MCKVCSLLLLGILLAFSLPVWAGEPLPPLVTQSMSDDLLRASAYNAQRSAGDSFGPAFVTNDTSRLTIMGRFPLASDGRYPKYSLGKGWMLGWTNDQYGRSVGFSHSAPDLPGLTHGVVRFGTMKEHVASPALQPKAAMGVSLSYTFK